MTDWIECNIPWQAEYYPTTPEAPDLSDREREVFGKSKVEREQEIDHWEIYEKEREIEKQIDPDYVLDYKDRLLKVADAMQNLAQSDDKVKAALEYKAFEEEYYEWYEKQPEIQAWVEECNRLEKAHEENKNGFVDRGLAKAGTMIETEDGRVLLIGNINQLGGVCDDCTAVSYGTIIKRYKVICDDPKESEL